MADTRDLEQVRADIDAIDQDIQALINRRAECAQRVAEIKMAEVAAAHERGETGVEPVFYRPEREAQVLENIISRSAGPLDARAWRISSAKSCQPVLPWKATTDCYLGPEGTFTRRRRSSISVTRLFVCHKLR